MKANSGLGLNWRIALIQNNIQKVPLHIIKSPEVFIKSPEVSIKSSGVSTKRSELFLYSSLTHHKKLRAFCKVFLT